jgi:hypothetical protein
MVVDFGLDLNKLDYGLVVDCCDCGNDCSGFIKCRVQKTVNTRNFLFY